MYKKILESIIEQANQLDNQEVSSDTEQDISKTEESDDTLEKSRPQLKVPAEKDISNRPDQEVYPASMASGKFVMNQKKDELFANPKEYVEKKVEMAQKGSKYSTQPANTEEKIREGQRVARKLKDDKSGESFGVSSPQKNNKSIAIASKGANKSVIPHEGQHVLFQQIADKHGIDNTNTFVDSLIDQAHPHIVEFADKILSNKPSYRAMKEHPNPRHNLAYKEEMVNMVRDFIESPARRGMFKESLGVDNSGQSKTGNPQHTERFRDLDGKVKQSWQGMVDHAKQYKFDKSEDSTIDLTKGVGKDAFSTARAAALTGAVALGGGMMAQPKSDTESSLSSAPKPKEMRYEASGDYKGTNVDQKSKFDTINAIATVDHPATGKYLPNNPTNQKNKYGMTNYHIKQTINNNSDLSDKYSDVLKQKPHRMQEYINDNHPKLHQEVAHSYYDHLHGHFGDKPEKIAHAWHYGVKNTKDKSEGVSGHWYVNKVMNKIDSLK